MKTKKLFGILSLLIIIGVTSCNSDTPQDNVENIKMKVSSEIGTYQPWGSDHFIDCMLVKEEGKNEYEALDFLGIAGFDYSKGYEYTLLVKKQLCSTLPPMPVILHTNWSRCYQNSE